MRLIDGDKLREQAVDIIGDSAGHKAWAIMSAITMAPTVEPMQWIPCSERMPNANEEDEKGYVKAYLVQDGRWMDVARWDGEYWVAWGYGIALRKVVAWMPLPEPMRLEKKD